jgi:hypothetical protein
MPKKKPEKLAVCPCCGQGRHRTEVTRCARILEDYERKLYGKHYKDVHHDSFLTIAAADFEWACDVCFAAGKAIPATPELQVTSHQPHLAYPDKALDCPSCKQPFLFKKGEKQLWYESLKFHISAVPKECPECRKNTRHRKLQTKRLSEILNKEELQVTVEEWSEVVQVYTDWGKEDKAAFYRSKIRKLSK